MNETGDFMEDLELTIWQGLIGREKARVSWETDAEGHCTMCRGSGQIAVGPWGSRPPKIKCPDCDGKWTRG